MQCKNCGDDAVFGNPDLCREHFIEYFEDKVQRTITEHQLLHQQDKVVVAASGGKDSTAVLHLLKKFHGNVDALAIDEGIAGYRDRTLDDLRNFCKSYGINLKIFSYKEEFGQKLDQMLAKTKTIPCSICGTLRRYLLNKRSQGYDKIATGHNMDDELQSILMNLLKNNMELNSRLGPKTGIVASDKFVQRIKPLYFCTEKEVLAYSVLMGFNVGFAECPHVPESFRAHVRDAINDYESVHPGTKQAIISKFISHLGRLKEHYGKAAMHERKLTSCSICAEACYGAVCKACQYVESLQTKKAQTFNSNLLQVKT